MNETDFQDLLASVKEMKAIERGEERPSRVFKFDPPNVKAIRGKLSLTQREFAQMIGVSVGTLIAKLGAGASCSKRPCPRSVNCCIP